MTKMKNSCQHYWLINFYENNATGIVFLPEKLYSYKEIMIFTSIHKTDV